MIPLKKFSVDFLFGFFPCLNCFFFICKGPQMICFLLKGDSCLPLSTKVLHTTTAAAVALAHLFRIFNKFHTGAVYITQISLQRIIFFSGAAAAFDLTFIKAIQGMVAYISTVTLTFPHNRVTASATGRL